MALACGQPSGWCRDATHDGYGLKASKARIRVRDIRTPLGPFFRAGASARFCRRLVVVVVRWWTGGGKKDTRREDTTRWWPLSLSLAFCLCPPSSTHSPPTKKRQRHEENMIPSGIRKQRGDTEYPHVMCGTRALHLGRRPDGEDGLPHHDLPFSLGPSGLWGEGGRGIVRSSNVINIRSVRGMLRLFKTSSHAPTGVSRRGQIYSPKTTGQGCAELCVWWENVSGRGNEDIRRGSQKNTEVSVFLWCSGGKREAKERQKENGVGDMTKRL